MQDEIKRIVESFMQLPYLFVGTGFSMRYAAAPSWINLLFDAWSLMNGDNDKQFRKLKQQIEYEMNNELTDIKEEHKKYYVNPKLASAIQDQFNSLFFKDDTFESKAFTEAEIESIIQNSYDPFKFYIAKRMSDVHVDKTKQEYKEIPLLIENQNKFSGIITTNYDCLIEQLFPDYAVNVGQDNMLLANTNNVSEIFKIHGSVSNPNSLVITEQDYELFNRKLKYLSAKLLTIFVEHPVIFIGYGMGDFNILKLFEEIAECLDADQIEKTKNNFIFITRTHDEPEGKFIKEIAFGTKRIFMTELRLNDYSLLYRAFSAINASLPVKVMRKLQNMVCKFVRSTEAHNNIIFGSFNSPDIDDEKMALYIGDIDTVSQMGFDYFSIMDIVEDILFDNKQFLCNKKLITSTFKNIRSSAGSTMLPIYKYIRMLNIPVGEVPNNYYVIKSYGCVSPNATERKSMVKLNMQYTTVDEITDDFPDHVAKQVANIKHYARHIDAESLGEYLREMYNDKAKLAKNLSSFKKLVALYDYKMYS